VGGAERYYFDLYTLLKSKGHKVAFFSMKDCGNVYTKWNKYFVSNINLVKDNFIKKITRIPYSLEAKYKINKLLDDFKPDLVHINNIYYYISPSILPEIKKRKIPIIQTVHDYQLISPVSALFYDGKICEITKKHSYYKALLNRSKKPYIATIMSVISQYIQHYCKFFENNVDCFIVPSKFMEKKLHEYGFHAKKIVCIPNFTKLKITDIKATRNKFQRYILYFGRLDESKGLLFLLNIAKELPNIEFKIIGNYTNTESAKNIQRFIKNNKLQNISIEPHQSTKMLVKNIINSEFIIVPSLWYENQPYSVLESLSLSKAVLASRIGGIPEMITDKKTGILFNPGDIDDCIKKIKMLWHNPKLVNSIGIEAKKKSKHYSPNVYYKRLLNIYTKTYKDVGKK
jgi:glycosyltransferase involved in cell wall biosynthesis